MGNTRLKVGLLLAVALLAAGCARMRARRAVRVEQAGQEHEIRCQGSTEKCLEAAATFCRSRFHRREFVVTRQIPDEGVLVVVCSAETE